MMARSEELHEDRPISGKIAALSFVLGMVALMGLSSAARLVTNRRSRRSRVRIGAFKRPVDEF